MRKQADDESALDVSRWFDPILGVVAATFHRRIPDWCNRRRIHFSLENNPSGLWECHVGTIVAYRETRWQATQQALLGFIRVERERIAEASWSNTAIRHGADVAPQSRES